MRVGWIGLGAMGGPMAPCVAEAGHDVCAFDVDPARAEGLAERGVRAAATVAEATAGAEVLVVMVATGPQAQAVLFGDGAAVAALEDGATVLMMSTIGPEASLALAARVREAGHPYVDAPVSGGVARAGQGDLLVFLGGAAEDLERVRDVVDALARSAPHCGVQAGDGQKVKLVNQLLCGVHIAAAAEALAFAAAIGLDPARARDLVRDGAAASFMLEDRGGRMVEEAFEDVNSALDIFVKDMGLVNDAARAVHHPAPLAAVAEGLYRTGARAGLGRKDDSILFDVARGRIPPAD